MPSNSLPEPDVAIAMPIDDLAIALLRHFEGGARIHRGNLTNYSAYSGIGGQGGRDLDEYVKALAEAYDWLDHRGLVAIEPGNHSGDAFITRRGRSMLDSADGPAMMRADDRLGMALHPAIESTARRQFVIGEYELAVFAAFKAVEVRVRALTGAPESLVGVPLMNQAFRDGGTLHSSDLEPGESDARMALFRGAIGVFKNPTSHRQVEYDDPTVAAEAVLFADLLMRILDEIEQG